MSESAYTIVISEDVLENQRLNHAYLYELVSCKSMEELVILKLMCLFPKHQFVFGKCNSFSRGSRRSDN